MSETDYHVSLPICDLSYSALTESLNETWVEGILKDYICTPILPDKCPKCEGPLNDDLECLKGDGYWAYLHGFWVWH